jgi:hypothetical protein
VSGSYSLPAIAVDSFVSDPDSHVVVAALRARHDIRWSKAQLKLEGAWHSALLHRDLNASRLGFYGSLDLPANVKEIGLGLQQDSLDQARSEMLHMTTALFPAGKDVPVYRGWVDVRKPGSPVAAVPLTAAESHFDVMAYPNIVDWQSLPAKSVRLVVKAYDAEPLVVTTIPERPLSLERDQATFVEFSVPSVADGAFGSITVFADDGSVVEKIPVRL